MLSLSVVQNFLASFELEPDESYIQVILIRVLMSDTGRIYEIRGLIKGYFVVEPAQLKPLLTYIIQNIRP